MAANIQELSLDKEFKVKFNGEPHEIDANTFVNSLIHLNTIIQEVNREMAPEKKIDVKIKALEKGSFLVHIELVQTFLEALPNLFTSANLGNAANIISVVAGLYGLKKFLSGRKPAAQKTDGNSVTIQNQNGNNITVTGPVYNIYMTNPTVNDALTKSFETLEKDESITGFSITDMQGIPIVEIPREDFGVLAEPNEAVENSASIFHDEAALLSIIKMSFDPRLKSDFYYNGNKITAKVTDQSFYKSIDLGRQFSKGDILKATLKINRVLDPSTNYYVNRTYEVIKVHEHRPRPQQGGLFSDDRAG